MRCATHCSCSLALERACLRLRLCTSAAALPPAPLCAAMLPVRGAAAPAGVLRAAWGPEGRGAHIEVLSYFKKDCSTSRVSCCVPYVDMGPWTLWKWQVLCFVARPLPLGPRSSAATQVQSGEARSARAASAVALSARAQAKRAQSEARCARGGQREARAARQALLGSCRIDRCFFALFFSSKGRPCFAADDRSCSCNCFWWPCGVPWLCGCVRPASRASCMRALQPYVNGGMLLAVAWPWRRACGPGVPRRGCGAGVVWLLVVCVVWGWGCR